MTYERERKPFAKALTKRSYQLGAPFKLLFAGYIPGIIIFAVTGWMWHFILAGVIWHIWARLKFEKDPLYFSYLIDSLKEPGHLEP